MVEPESVELSRVMKILTRYVLREHVAPFIAAIGVLTGLMLLNQLARRFSDLVGKGLPWYVIAEVFGLSIPFIVAMTMPMAVLVAVLYTFSRLAGDNEITAFKAGGVSLIRLMVPVLLASSLVAGGMMWFNDRVLPESNHALRQLLSDIGKKQPTFELRERVINEVVQNKLFLQAARIERVRSMLRDLVIFDLGRPAVERTIYADSGLMAFNESQTDLYLTLFDGSVHELDTNDPAMNQLTHYAKQIIRVSGVSNELERGSSSDWRGDREMNIGMMKEEVRRRRERLAELRDSLALFVEALAPSPDTASEAAGEPSPALGDDPTDAEDALQRQRRIERARDAARTLAADSPAKAAALPAPTDRGVVSVPQNLRGRFNPLRRGGWPPRGDPVTYAAQVRSELQRMASRAELQQREVNKYSVEIQKKFAIPVAAIVFVLIGAPVGVRFPRGGIGMVIGVSLTVFCVYYVFLIGGEDIADRGFMSPFWAMWTPNALFTALGCFLLLLVTRAGTRGRRDVLSRLPALLSRRRPSRAKLDRGRKIA